MENVLPSERAGVERTKPRLDEKIEERTYEALGEPASPEKVPGIFKDIKRKAEVWIARGTTGLPTDSQLFCIL
ncbi:MAG: hypothetical protein ACE5I5_12615 [Candidatus Heimdallarchaeota archaeon]